MGLLSKLNALRLLAVLLSLSLLSAFFLPKGATAFLTGLALGLSVGIHALIWGEQEDCCGGCCGDCDCEHNHEDEPENS